MTLAKVYFADGSDNSGHSRTRAVPAVTRSYCGRAGCHHTFFPLPRRRDNLVERAVLRNPSEHPPYLVGAGDQYCRIPRSPRADDDGDVAAGHPRGRIDHFFDGVPVATSQIEDFGSQAAVGEGGERRDVRASEIGHMDI